MDMTAQTILLAEWDTLPREQVRDLLKNESYRVIEAETGPQALEYMGGDVDLVILDLRLPELSSLEVCRRIRMNSTVPILLLADREADRMEGLAVGVDECLPRSCSEKELIVRIKALLRRYFVYRGKEQSGSGKDSILSLGRIRLNRTENQVWVRGREVDLTSTEYRILRLLMEHPHRVFSPGQVYERVWGKPDPGPTRPVMVHIRNLRTKIEEDPSQPQYLKTSWGKGYRFEVSRHKTKA